MDHPAPVELPHRSETIRWARGLSHRVGLSSGIAIMGILVVCAILGPRLTPYDPLHQDMHARLRRPGAVHVLGTDPLGRDLLSRLIFGARISLGVSGLAVAVGAAVGVTLGLIGGYRGGAADHLITRAMDAAISFPGLLLALFLVALFGASLLTIVVALAFVYVPQFALVVRARVLTIRGQEFVLGVVALGARSRRVIARHILPNVATVVLVQVTLSLGSAMLTEASLSFLGLGIPPPAPSWGAMLKMGYPYLELAPWIAIAPALTIFVAVLGLNFLGDGLADVLDPRG